MISWVLKWLSSDMNTCQVCKKYMRHHHYTDKFMRTLNKYICNQCIESIPWIRVVLCEHCGRTKRCPDCILRDDGALLINRSSVVYDHNMKSWLHRYKFQGEETMTALLGLMLIPGLERLTYSLWNKYDYHQYQLWNKDKTRRSPLTWLSESNLNYWDVIVPVPISAERLRERGFNQAQQMAQVLSVYFHIPIIALLERAKHGTRQSHQGKSGRIEGIEQRYVCNELAWNQLLRLTGIQRTIKILLVDDIYTTGSTVHACAEALQKFSPCSIAIASLTLARS